MPITAISATVAIRTLLDSTSSSLPARPTRCDASLATLSPSKCQTFTIFPGSVNDSMLKALNGTSDLGGL